MKCPLCNKDIISQSVDVGDGIVVHLDCFFDDSVPNANTYTGTEDERKKKRLDAMVTRCEDIRKQIEEQ